MSLVPLRSLCTELPCSATQPGPFSATHVHYGNGTPRNKRLDLRIELTVALDESVIESSNRLADNALPADTPVRGLCRSG